ncbi:hypothetical protein BJ944DRAFT_247165 [Cunninghamella echinulata]|nr:hypothetical protein BJ944DRAFT_247165 [Cunninghamella echinulata]
MSHNHQLLNTYTNTSDLQKLEEELDLLKKKREARRQQQNIKRLSTIGNNDSSLIKEIPTKEKKIDDNINTAKVKKEEPSENLTTKSTIPTHKSCNEDQLQKNKLNKKDTQAINNIITTKVQANTTTPSHYDEMDKEHSLLISKLKSSMNYPNRKSNKLSSINNLNKLKSLYDSAEDDVNAKLLSTAFKNLNSTQSTPTKKNAKPGSALFELKKSCSSQKKSSSEKKVPSLKKLKALQVKTTIHNIDSNQKNRPKWKKESSLSKLKSTKGKVSTAISALENTTPSPIHAIKEIKTPQPLAKYELPTSPIQLQSLDTSISLLSPSSLLSASSQSFNIISPTTIKVTNDKNTLENNSPSPKHSNNTCTKKHLPPKKPKRTPKKSQSNNDLSFIASYYEPQLSPLAGECSHNLSSIYLKSKKDIEVEGEEETFKESNKNEQELTEKSDKIGESSVTAVESPINDIHNHDLVSPQSPPPSSSSPSSSSSSLSSSSSSSSSSSLSSPSSAIMNDIMNDINKQLTPREIEKKAHIKADRDCATQQEKRNNSQRKLRVINVDTDHNNNDEHHHHDSKMDTNKCKSILDTSLKQSSHIEISDTAFKKNDSFITSTPSSNSDYNNQSSVSINNAPSTSYPLDDNYLNYDFNNNTETKRQQQSISSNQYKRYSDESYFDYRYDYHMNPITLTPTTTTTTEKQQHRVHRKRVSFSSQVTVIPELLLQGGGGGDSQNTREFWNAFTNEMGHHHQESPTMKLLDKMDKIKNRLPNEKLYIPTFLSNMSTNSNQYLGTIKDQFHSMNNTMATPSSSTPSPSTLHHQNNNNNNNNNRLFNLNKFLKSKNDLDKTTVNHSWWKSSNTYGKKKIDPPFTSIDHPISSSPPLSHPTKDRPKKPASLKKKNTQYKMIEPLKPPAIAQPDWKNRIPISKYQRVTYA